MRRQSISWCRGRRVRAARSTAPVTACTVRSRSRCSSSSVTWRTTARAVARLCSGITSLRPTRVVTSPRSGCTAAIVSGSSSSSWSPRRVIASACMTCTTDDGK
ncbi:hypothetical protein [Nocardioides sp. TF02-7]|uniref:hypothetical protein n=1 Tax=Nocardioides sp. TF02-7 TaxID=2917724 RepID=UPI001F066A27|nr:hypothetical protein [Nocardioides sp. TF02-7]UMG94611.1 hypothetical protein MF408_12055 [Nocardioides sp. TF02-7]